VGLDSVSDGAVYFGEGVEGLVGDGVGKVVDVDVYIAEL
jgi:hypothetical protein